MSDHQPKPLSLPQAKSFYLKTFGCQMNVYDSERMMEALAAEGYAETQIVENADLVILNTCHIREKAAEKVYSDLGRIRDIKTARQRAGKDTVITVAGCVAQAEGAEIVRRQPAVDLVIGPQSYHRLPELLGRVTGKSGAIVETEFTENQKFEVLPKTRPRLPSPPRADSASSRLASAPSRRPSWPASRASVRAAASRSAR